MHSTEFLLHTIGILLAGSAALWALQLINLTGRMKAWLFIASGLVLLAASSYADYLMHRDLPDRHRGHLFIFDVLPIAAYLLLLAGVISLGTIFRERRAGLDLLAARIQRLKSAPPEVEMGMTASERATRQALIKSGKNGVSVITALKYLELEDRRIAQTLQEWRATFDAITIPIFVYDQSYRLIRANRAYVDRSGMAMKDIVGQPYFDVFPKLGHPIIDPPQSSAQDTAKTEICLGTGEIFISENCPIYSENNEYRYTQHTLQEVTQAKHAERSIRRIRLTLKVATSCIRDMLRASNEAHMLQTVCKVAVNSGLYRFAWIGKMEHDENKTLRPLAQHHVTQDPEQIPVRTWDNTADKRSPIGEAIQTGKTCVVQDLMHDSRFSQLHHFAARNHLASAVALPLHQGPDIWGGLVLYSDEPNAFSDEEIHTLEILSASVAFGITARHSGSDDTNNLLPMTSTLNGSRANLEKIIVALEAVIATRRHYGSSNQRLVGAVGMAIALEMGLPHERAYGVRLAGILHDVGEIKVPEEILSKTGKLTGDERAQMQRHAQAGYEILSELDLPWPLAQTVLQHHERMDGSGYPQGLTGEQILLEARIIAVADTLVAITYQHKDHPRLGIPAALAEVEKGKGTLFDAAVVDATLRLFREKGYQIP